MAKTLRVGDLLKLPSGRSVRIMCKVEPERPWAAVETGWIWHVIREHGLPAAGVSFYFHADRPIQLDEEDARALAKALNGVI